MMVTERKWTCSAHVAGDGRWTALKFHCSSGGRALNHCKSSLLARDSFSIEVVWYMVCSRRPLIMGKISSRIEERRTKALIV